MILIVMLSALFVASIGSLVLGFKQHTPADFEHFEVSRGEMKWVDQ